MHKAQHCNLPSLHKKEEEEEEGVCEEENAEVEHQVDAMMIIDTKCIIII
jgi:hypothetical protein